MNELIAFRLCREELHALDWIMNHMGADGRSHALRELIYRSARANGYDCQRLARLAARRRSVEFDEPPPDEEVPEKVIDISGKDSAK